MKILVLGTGLQGRAAVHDLVLNGDDVEVVAADLETTDLQSFLGRVGLVERVRVVQVDVSRPAELDSLIAEGFAVIVDLLPVALHDPVTAAAVRHGCHLVNASYASEGMRELAARAAERGVALLPELGLDPGLDLLLLGEAVCGFDTIEEIRSYGAGFPEAGAAEGPLRYKATWTLEGVLRSYTRRARVIRDGAAVHIPAAEIFRNDEVHELTIEGVGTLEAFPNGDCLPYLELLGLDLAGLRHVGRYVLRWPGHCALWRRLVDLGLLDDEPVVVDGRPVHRRRYLAAALEPLVRYEDDERDVAVVRVEVAGVAEGRKQRTILEVVDRRDLDTGLFAMNRSVGYVAAIGALLLARGVIPGRGLLSPVRDVPFVAFTDELRRRGIEVLQRCDL